jgi:putative membrane protein insertion efficiency factor
LKDVILLLIILYQKIISPFLPKCCRFYPSCSDYLYQTVEKHGVIKGFRYGVKRVLRCNPFHEGGYDPVPEE